MRTRPQSFWIAFALLALALAGVGLPQAARGAATPPVPAQPAPTICPGPFCVYLPLVIRPIIPELNDPIAGPVDSIAPTLAWTPAITYTRYIIEVYTTPDFAAGTDAFTTTETLRAPSQEVQHTILRNNLDGSTTYYWRVGVRLPEGTNYSPVGQFTTAPDDPARYPAPPSQVSPPNGAKITTTTPTLVWAPVPGGDTYRVRIVDRATGKTVRTSSLIEAPQTSYTVPAGDLSRFTTYRWQLKVHTSYGWCDYGPFWDIKIQ